MIKADSIINNEKISFILTHLHSKNENLRLKELKIIQQYLKTDANIILMGDLNTLSPLDDYDEIKLIDKMSKLGINKFGIKKLRKEVIQKIINQGFTDAIRKFSKSFEYSVPTTSNKDEKHFTKLRLDYIFVSKLLARKLTNAKIIRTKETNQLSDHFPVIIEIDI